ncbi:MAG TPA: hypothetical protein VIL61_10025 [Nitrospiria bacterium]
MMKTAVLFDKGGVFMSYLPLWVLLIVSVVVLVMAGVAGSKE